MSSLSRLVAVALVVGSCSSEPSPRVDSSPIDVPDPAPAPVRRVWIRAVGDVMLARGMQRQWQGAQGLDALFAGVGPALQAPDIAFANLESVAAISGSRADKAIAFRTHPNAVLALRDAGFDVLSLANNHSEDFGRVALAESVRRLEEVGISVAGANRDGILRRPAVVLTRQGVRTAFLAYTVFKPTALRVTDEPDSIALIADQIDEANLRADFVVVSFHWGIEYQVEPTDRQRTLGRLAIEAGADLVLGHHPHRLQGVEVYRGRAIAYSLGNFVFDQPPLETRETTILDWTVREDGVQELALMPVRITPRPFAPRLLLGENAKPVLETLRRLSADLGTEVTIENGVVRIEGVGELPAAPLRATDPAAANVLAGPAR